MQATVDTVNDNVDTTLSYEMESKMKYKFAAIEKRKEARAENISKVMTAIFNFDSFPWIKISQLQIKDLWPI